MMSIQYRIRFLGGLVLIGGLGLGCSSPDLSGPVSTDASKAYWTLALSAHAITMSTTAPYDTLQLTATPLNVAGAPLTGVPAPTFTTTDSSVRVSAAGLLTARAVRSNVKVVATLTYQGVRLVDTAVINVTAAIQPPMLRQLQLGVMPGDSTTLATPAAFSFFYASSSKTLLAAARDSTGTLIPSAMVALRTSKPVQASIEAPMNAGLYALVTDSTAQVDFSGSASRPGVVTVYASATVYGVTLQDSMQLTLTAPFWAGFHLTQQATLENPTPVVTLTPSFPAVIGVGGIVWWINTASDSVDIVFDDPTAASDEGFLFSSGDGNIPPFPGSATDLFVATRARKFLRAGTVHFHSVRTGVSGTIIVQ